MIFAVTKNQQEIYEKLSDFIEGSVVGELANDSSNVVKLVRKNYEVYTKTIPWFFFCCFLITPVEGESYRTAMSNTSLTCTRISLQKYKYIQEHRNISSVYYYYLFYYCCMSVFHFSNNVQ